MRSLTSKRKYNIDLFKKDLIGGFSAAAWIFPLCLAFGVNSPFGAAAGILGGIAACLLGLNSSSKVSVPSLSIFIVLLYAATQIGVSGAFISAILAGVMLIVASNFKISKKVLYVSPVIIGAISFAVAVILCITQVNFYFGIGIPQGHALFTLAAYKSFGFHSNWRGVLFGTITLVIMITYPIKFKKFSKKVPENFVSLVGTVLLNILLLNPDSTHSVIDEIGKFPSYLVPSISSIDFSVLRTKQIIPILLYSVAIFFIYLTQIISSEKQPNDIRNSLLAKGVNSSFVPMLGGLPTSEGKDSLGGTKLANVYAAIIMIAFAFIFHPVLERIPTATLAVIIIVLGWKSPEYKAMKEVFIARKYKIIKIVLMFVLIFIAVAWNIVYLIDILAFISIIYSIIKLYANKKENI